MDRYKSGVWKFFKILQEDEKKAVCLVCPESATQSSKEITRGKTVKSFSTKPLWNHLAAKHPKTYTEVKSNSNKDEVVVLDCGEQQVPELSQLNLVNMFQRKQPWSIDDKRSEEITKKICEMMALDCEPFALVEREGFQRLMKHLVPQYSLPSRSYFSQKVMPNIFEKLSTAIKKKLINISYISFTTDIWTCSTNNASFISLTAHGMNAEIMKRETFILAVKHFPVSHTGLNISQMLCDSIESWEIGREKIHVIVTDNATNMVSGMSLMSLERVPCFIHTLQLVINDALFVQREVVEILAKSRKIVSHFNHSSIACSKLKTLQENLKINCHKMIQDVSTRWNSTYYMLSRLYEQKQAVTAYAAEHDIPTLTAYQWHTVENLVNVLKPFEEMTKLASAEDETIAYVIPAIATLNTYLIKRCTDASLQIFKSELKLSLQQRFLSAKGLNIQQSQNFVLATLLDPRFKNRFLQDYQKAEDLILNELMADSIDGMQSTSKKNVIVASEKILPAADAHTDIWQCFDELANGSASETDSSFENEVLSNLKRQGSDRSRKRKANYKLEIEKYINLSLLPRQESPLLWWKQNGGEFPNLKKLAGKYLCAPPSSVESERLFSAASAVYTENRNRLAPEKAEKLIFIMKNMKIVNFNY